MAKKPSVRKIEQKIKAVLTILEKLGFPRQQQNERSALTLLALLNMKPDDSWENASNPLMGITPMMDFFAKHYGRRYAPNTRETVRRQTVHQFMQAGIIAETPTHLIHFNGERFLGPYEN
jgi:adenine-specific DNA-methyltransferase